MALMQKLTTVYVRLRTPSTLRLLWLLFRGVLSEGAPISEIRARTIFLLQ